MYILFFQAMQIHRECMILCEGRNLRPFVIDKVNKAPKKLSSGQYDIVVTTPNRFESILNCNISTNWWRLFELWEVYGKPRYFMISFSLLFPFVCVTDLSTCFNKILLKYLWRVLSFSSLTSRTSYLKQASEDFEIRWDDQINQKHFVYWCHSYLETLLYDVYFTVWEIVVSIFCPSWPSSTRHVAIPARFVVLCSALRWPPTSNSGANSISTIRWASYISKLFLQRQKVLIQTLKLKNQS